MDELCVSSACGGGISLSGDTNNQLTTVVAISAGQVVYVGLDNDGNVPVGHQMTLLVEQVILAPTPPPSAGIVSKKGNRSDTLRFSLYTI